MKIKEFVIGLLLIVGVFMMGRWTAPEPEPIKETVTVTDSTVVDSLESQVVYWRDIAETDTVRETIEVPVPVERDNTNIYDVPYSDSTLTANIGLTIDGLLEEIDFEYYLKREIVEENTRTIFETRYVERTRTITVPEKPTNRLRFDHSIEGGYKFTTDLTEGVPTLEQSPYLQYRPEFSVIGIDLVGTAHLSENSFVTIGIKKEF